MIEQSRQEVGHSWRRVVGVASMECKGVEIVHVGAVAVGDGVDEGRGTVEEGPTGGEPSERTGWRRREKGSRGDN